MPCCKCNSSGTCARCRCSKIGKECQDCVPSKLNKCKNRLNNHANGNRDFSAQRDLLSPPSDMPTRFTSPAWSGRDHQQRSIDDNSEGNESVLRDQNEEVCSQICIPQGVRDRLEQLLSPPDVEPQNFIWGDSLSGTSFCNLVDKAYDEAIHWRRNIFMLPYGKVSKSFVQELSNLLQAFAEKSSYERIALKASFLMQVLLLQKPFAKSKCKDHIAHLS